MLNYEKLKNAMADLDEDIIYSIIDEVLADGGTEAPKAMEACQEGMAIIGERFEANEYFVGDLIFSGEVLTEVLDKLKPVLNQDSAQKTGRLIICSVEGDLHDIGKNIVKGMLEANGFDVIDLGVDVKPEIIVDTVKKEGIKIVCLSGVLTLALDSMKKTVDAFKAAGIRDDVKILVGGLPINADTGAFTGADEWAYNPSKTVNTCLAWAK